jgi:hypothetical protein
MERGLYMDGSERFFIAGAGLTVPPDAELDLLQFKGNGSKTSEYRIILPPTGPRPDGIVQYYDCNVMKVREF